MNNELAMTYSHMGNPTLPSALRGFTSEFGKGSGGSLLLWSPAQLFMDTCFVLLFAEAFSKSLQIGLIESDLFILSSGITKSSCFVDL